MAQQSILNSAASLLPPAPADAVSTPRLGASEAAARLDAISAQVAGGLSDAERERVGARLAGLQSLCDALRAAEVPEGADPGWAPAPLVTVAAVPEPATAAPPYPAVHREPNHDLAGELLWKTLDEIGAALRAGQVTSAALTEVALRRLETTGAALNAVATITPELARAQAEQADQELAQGRDRGPLHGIPYGAKDLLDTANIPTQFGSPAHAGRTPGRDAAAIERLRAAGAVLVAKLSLVELAGGGGYANGLASLHGAMRNPWNPDCWTGGSSSGSGAAVGGGLTPFAIGSETWGSIFCPAAFCGVTGLRPTYGRVPRSGAMALSWTMDKIGPLARSARCCRLVLHALAGSDPGDASSLALPPTRFDGALQPAASLRVGVVRAGLGDGADTEVVAAFETALAALGETGARLENAELPDLPFNAAASTIIFAEGAAAFADLLRSGEYRKLVDEPQQAGLLAGLAVSASDYARALQLRATLGRALVEVFSRFDVLVAPTYLRVAPAVEEDLNTYLRGDSRQLGGATNLCGLPGVSVPMGFGRGGLPVGLQINAGAGNEAAVLDAAEHFQRATNWHRCRPTVA